MFITEVFRLFNYSMRKITILLLIIFVLTFFLIGCKSKPVAAQPKLEIKDPTFEIISIAVIQADIVITEFETILRIKNPNDFPLELKSLTYELFGKGSSWAKGKMTKTLRVPALGYAETRFVFEMNFINMSRSLLDDVIAMRQVQYRFKGSAEVQPLIPNVEVFTAFYDRSGLSEVKR